MDEDHDQQMQRIVRIEAFANWSAAVMIVCLLLAALMLKWA